MKTCLITPIPDLDRFVSDYFEQHLILAHLFELPGWGETYARFYKRRAQAGDFITIDNGAKEGSLVDLKTLLQRAAQVRAKEIVIPDVLLNQQASLHTSLEALYALQRHEYEYEEAGRPQLMLVPQGKTISEWQMCMLGLEVVAEEVMTDLNGPQFSFGIPYAYAHVMGSGEYMDLIRIAVERVTQVNVHLLGWPRQLELLMNVADEFPHLRSVDSSRPIVYAQAGEHATGAAEYPGRRSDYFTTPTAWDAEGTVHINIDIFRAFAREPLIKRV